jgi:hypothetical protein
MSTIEVKSAVIPHINLVINDVNDQGESITKTFKLVYDYRAIARAEESIGVDLKSFEAWKELKSSMTPKLVLAGLAKYHPDVPLDYLLDVLNPTVQRNLQDALFEYLFPGVMDLLKKAQAEHKSGDSKNVQGGTEAATPSV